MFVNSMYVYDDKLVLTKITRTELNRPPWRTFRRRLVRIC